MPIRINYRNKDDLRLFPDRSIFAWSSELRVPCSCGESITIRRQWAGMNVECAKCNRVHCLPSSREMGNFRQRVEIYTPENQSALLAPVIHTIPKTRAEYILSFVFILLRCCACVLIFALAAVPFALLSFAFPTTIGGDKILADLFSLSISPIRPILDRNRNIFDFRRPILFLRSHTDDGMLFDRAETGMFSDKASNSDDEGASFELVMAKSLVRYGPLVALRTNYQSDAPFHFRRYLVDQTEWQRQILYWIRRASLIVIQVGPTNSLSDRRYGLAWEIATVLAMNCPHKVLVVLPPVEENERRCRWEAYQRLVIAECGGGNFSTDNLIGLVATCESGWKHTFAVRGEPTPPKYSQAIRSIIIDRYWYRMPLAMFLVVSLFACFIVLVIRYFL